MMKLRSGKCLSNIISRSSSNSIVQNVNPKKPRMSRAEKKLRKVNVDGNEMSLSKRDQKIKSTTTVQDPIIQLLMSARKSLHTGAVNISDASCLMSSISVITTCNECTTTDDLSAIYVKPLLVLDLNGILCHRIRPEKECPEIFPRRPEVFFRPVVAHIANTNIIPRIDLQDFLNFLSDNFCLAVWTSAKAKNANALVQMLFPETVRNRLLFVWAQHDCKSVKDEKSTIPTFMKDLQQIWDKYPLWNSSNTLIVDDSPEKCISWAENAVHPPAMNGLKPEGFELHSNKSKLMLDDENANHQRKFFTELVDHWKLNYTVHDWDSESGDVIVRHVSHSQFHFLQKNPLGRMVQPSSKRHSI